MYGSFCLLHSFRCKNYFMSFISNNNKVPVEKRFYLSSALLALVSVGQPTKYRDYQYFKNIDLFSLKNNNYPVCRQLSYKIITPLLPTLSKCDSTECIIFLHKFIKKFKFFYYSTQNIKEQKTEKEITSIAIRSLFLLIGI